MKRDQRRLTAIVSADVVGYSRLMGRDEGGTLAALKAHVAELIDPKIAEYGGRTVKRMGDGLLLEFPSVVEAVRCALDVQRGMAERSAGVPGDRQLRFRVGINVGDIIIDGDDIFGDGVNVAARLQALAEPGEVWVSRGVRDQVAGKLAVDFEDLGPREVKNIAVPIDVFRVREGASAPAAASSLAAFALGLRRIASAANARRVRDWGVPAAAIALLLAGGALVWNATRPAGDTAQVRSIAVLPLRPIEATAGGVNYLGMGLADAMINRLSLLEHLTIRSTSAVRKYDSAGQDPLAAGREQRVDAVLEGTIQTAGSRIRVVLRLVRTADGGALWAGRFDESTGDIFRMQDSVAHGVAGALALKLSGDDERRLARRVTQSGEAYDLYLRGRYQWTKFTPGALDKALEYFKQATAIDPKFALAYSGISDVYGVRAALGFARPREVWAQAKDNAARAVALDPALPEGLASVAAEQLFLAWEFAAAKATLDRALAINPKLTAANSLLSYHYQVVGRTGEAVALLREALKRDPLSPLLNIDFAMALYIDGAYEEALRAWTRVVEVDPSANEGFVITAQALERLGRYDDAIAECERAMAHQGRRPFTLAALAYAWGSAGQGAAARALAQEMEAIWKQSYFSPMLLVFAYTGIGDRDRAFAWLRQAIDLRDPQVIWLGVDPQLAPLRSDPRFEALRRRIGPAT